MSTRADDAGRLRQQIARTPDDRVAWHNLAAAEGDIGRVLEAEFAARRAISLGVTAPETRLVLARALQSQGRLDEAERAFEAALELRPNYAEAHRDYAQLVWMRNGDVELALQKLDSSLAATGETGPLQLIRSIALEYANELSRALTAAEMGIKSAPNHSELLLQAAHLCLLTNHPQRALEFARRARNSDGGVRTQTTLCEISLALGDLDGAQSLVAWLKQAIPDNQYVIALGATLWRLQGDTRYASLFNYDELVSAQQLIPPAGWPSLEHFLRAVGSELDGMHRFTSHPFHQSLRGGGQLTFSEDDMARPLLRELFNCIGISVSNYLVRLGRGTDPVRSRNTLRSHFTGAWSVRLPSGGSHVDHVHPNGWISSACYISLPATLGDGDAVSPSSRSDRSGWLRLGQPGIVTKPLLGPEYFVKPQPGTLVLFPAYMWHGVEPFKGDERRLTVAFDLVPG